ncbi:MAG: sigma-70 family RNA polymerase sigma factor [Bryobacteraceae bacterium]
MHNTARGDGVATDEEDIALVERVLAGDRTAFECLVRKHERRVFRVALAILGNFEDAEEAMQDAFVKSFRHLGQFRRESRFTTWLTRIAANEAIQKRNARKTFVSLAELESVEGQFTPKRYEPWRTNPEQLYGKQEVHRIVEDSIQSLPDIYRGAFVLRDIEQLSAEEAAGLLGIGVPALKSRLLRARLLMREALADKFEEPPTWKTKIVHGAVDAATAMAMRLMRAGRR